MKHLVVTKYNLNDGTGRHINTEWLEDRYNLFTTWAYASLRNQSVQDFTWLVFMAKETPADYIEKMVGLGDDYPNMKVQLLQGKNWAMQWEDWMSRVRYYSEGETEIYTTRMDSDDAIHKDYLMMARDTLHKSGQFAQALYGYMCKDGQVYKRQYARNPFFTHLESIIHVNDLRTVNRYQHCHVPLGSIKYYDTETPMWIQHAHENTGWNKDTLKDKDMLTDWMPLDTVREGFGI